MISLKKVHDLKECSKIRKCLNDLDLAIKCQIENNYELAQIYFQRSLLNEIDYINYNYVKELLKDDPLLDYFKPLVFFNNHQISIKISYLIHLYMQIYERN